MKNKNKKSRSMRWGLMMTGGVLAGILPTSCEADILRAVTPFLGGPLDPVLFFVAPFIT